MYYYHYDANVRKKGNQVVIINCLVNFHCGYLLAIKDHQQPIDSKGDQEEQEQTREDIINIKDIREEYNLPVKSD